MLEIVAKSAAAPVNEEGEAEVDIDALDNATLLELEEYVNGVLDVRIYQSLLPFCLPLCVTAFSFSICRFGYFVLLLGQSNASNSGPDLYNGGSRRTLRGRPTP